MNSIASVSDSTARSDPAEQLVARVDAIASALSGEKRLVGVRVARPHPLLVTARQGALVALFLPRIAWSAGTPLLRPFAQAFAAQTAVFVLVGAASEGPVDGALDAGLAATLPEHPSAEELYVTTARALELLDAKDRAAERGQSLSRYRYELGEFMNIARAMTTERDVGKLLDLILEKARITTGADAGSIYVVEGDEKGRSLRFKLTQNASVRFDAREFVMPLSARSIAGFCALQKETINLPDVYDLPPGSPYGFDRSFDERIGYVTRSMLVAPLISKREEVIGVIQLINKKRNSEARLRSRADVDAQVVAFDQRSEELLGLLGTQAGASLETAMLYTEIGQLFSGFVRASVEAIEARDPTTSGHSRRVAELTVELARRVDRETRGPYAPVAFGSEDLRELEYASLLHDFGKIGVREKVLVKAKKLYDEQLELIRGRFDYVTRSLEAEVLARKFRTIERGGSREALAALDAELAARRAELDRAFSAVLAANEPTVMQAGDFARIEAIGKETYTDLGGVTHALLSDDEVQALSVKRGSLTAEEFDEIRSHVTHTFRFLSQIPWGNTLRRVPLIASAHHERLNGTGYPSRLRSDEIPLQSKMMAIADIFDALTAADRPYKRAVPVERAMDILDYNVRDGHLDGELLRIFGDGRVWEALSGNG